MPDIPDKVIEQAARAACRAQDDQEQFIHGFAPDDFEPSRFQSGEEMGEFEAGIAAAAPVIAAWARDQERAKWEARIERDLAAQRSIADSSSCESARQEATYCAGHLRSLLTEEEA